MPAEERCQWSDLSSLLDGDLRKRYRALPCAERDRLGARLWWLARPLLSQTGNDRRSEHFARLAVVRLMREARTAYGLSWGGDLTEITLRYGWPRWWTQAPPPRHGPARRPDHRGSRDDSRLSFPPCGARRARSGGRARTGLRTASAAPPGALRPALRDRLHHAAAPVRRVPPRRHRPRRGGLRSRRGHAVRGGVARRRAGARAGRAEPGPRRPRRCRAR